MTRTHILAASLAIVAAAPAVAQANVRSFQTPSHNIACIIDVDNRPRILRCDIAKHDWKATKKPKSCHFDWGNGLVMAGRSRVAFTCASDTVLHQGPVLRYGKRITVGPFTCLSRPIGLTCRNGAGHGFLLSRHEYKFH